VLFNKKVKKYFPVFARVNSSFQKNVSFYPKKVGIFSFSDCVEIEGVFSKLHHLSRTVRKGVKK